MLAAMFKCPNVSLGGVHATLSWLWLSPSHRNGGIGHYMASMTALTFLCCHLSQLLIPTGGLWSQWPPWCGSNWSVLTVIFHISKESQSLVRIHFLSDMMIARSWPYTSWCQSRILFSWVSIQSLPLLSLQEALILSVSLLSSLYGHLLCVWVGEAVSRGCVQVRVSHVSPWQAWVWRCLISSTLWPACGCPIVRIGEGPGGTRRGARARGFLLLLSRAGSGLWY